MQKSIKKMSASRACTEIIWIFKKCINVTFNASVTLFREFNGALLVKHAIPKGAHWQVKVEKGVLFCFSCECGRVSEDKPHFTEAANSRVWLSTFARSQGLAKTEWSGESAPRD